MPPLSRDRTLASRSPSNPARLTPPGRRFPTARSVGMNSVLAFQGQKSPCTPGRFTASSGTGPSPRRMRRGGSADLDLSLFWWGVMWRVAPHQRAAGRRAAAAGAAPACRCPRNLDGRRRPYLLESGGEPLDDWDQDAFLMDPPLGDLIEPASKLLELWTSELSWSARRNWVACGSRSARNSRRTHARTHARAVLADAASRARRSALDPEYGAPDLER